MILHLPALKNRHSSKGSTAHRAVGHLTRDISTSDSGDFGKVHLGCATVRSDLIEVWTSDVNSSHDEIGANVALVPEQAYKIKSKKLKLN